MNDDLARVLRPHREAVEAALAAECDRMTGCPRRLAEAIRYSLLAPGKRLRPVLCRLACEAAGGDAGDATPAAVAVECVHAYSLIHDDLPAMDDDDLRRGRPTCHKRFDEATAILAGDALQAMAFAAVARTKHDAAGCVADLASAAGPGGMVGGQAADLDAETTPVTDAEALASIHRRKTGRLIAAACSLGGRVAAADPQTLRDLTEYGLAIGLAFQVADDLLDATGDAQTMGKQVRKDHERGKATYPGLLGVDASRRRADDYITEANAALGRLAGRLAHTQDDPVAPLRLIARYVIDRDR